MAASHDHRRCCTPVLHRRRLEDRRPGPAGRSHRRHDPLLPARGAAPPGRAVRAHEGLRADAPPAARAHQHLQSRRFSLAAIRALLDQSREGLLEGIFGEPTGGTAYARRARRALGHRPRARDRDPRRQACCATPPSTGATATTARTSTLLRTMGELARLGLPRKALVELGRIYAAGIEATQADVIELFTAVASSPGPMMTSSSSSSHAAGEAARTSFPARAGSSTTRTTARCSG